MITEISPHLSVYHGHINVGIIRDGNRALLIDFGDGSAVQHLGKLGLDHIDTVLFTHHHRDQACGIAGFADRVGAIVVPAAEGSWFADVASYWNDPNHRWHLYTYHPHRLMLAESIRVDRRLSDGDAIDWGPARITALATPGHTDGSLSYVVDLCCGNAGSRRTLRPPANSNSRSICRVAFCGDVVHSPGRIWELWSMQKQFGVQDYHGFLGSREELITSLRRLQSARPDVLIPSHGEIMRDPGSATETLIDRIRACYDKYIETTALRHYWPDLFPDYPLPIPSLSKDDRLRTGFGMSPSPHLPVPGFLRHFGTTWLILSESGAAFVMDCGYPGAVDELKRMLSAGEITSIDGLWITHYHDDHVDAVPAFQEAFDCECIADASVAEVVTDPPAWRLPGNPSGAARVDRVTREGQSWQWREFRMTAYHLPGQTTHHGGLLVEGHGLRMLFAGDSFTPSGIDDYCAPNRNFLGTGVGFDRCIRLVRELRPDLIFNEHVDCAFRFTDDQIDYILRNLAEREVLYGELLPWDHPNHGMDESWVRCHPYEQHVRPGETVEIGVVVTNHSSLDHEVSAQLVPPPSWRLTPGDTRTATVPAKGTAKLPMTLTVPPDAGEGRHVIAVNVIYGGRSLPQFAEAVIVVSQQ